MDDILVFALLRQLAMMFDPLCSFAFAYVEVLYFAFEYT